MERTLSNQIPHFIRFGVFELDTHSGELRKAGMRVRLQGQPLQVLVILLERGGEVVTREEVRSRIWPNQSFGDTDHALNKAIARIREALGDSAETPRYIDTLPRHGYRFIGTILPPQSIPQVSKATDHAPERFAAGKTSSSHFYPRLAAAGFLVLASLALVLYAARRAPSHRASRAVVGSVAVLPLQNLSADPNEEFFADGMTDELITSLAKISSLRVISRTSTMRYRGTHKSVSEIAGELGVDAIVEGTILRNGGKIRVTAQLIQASTDQHLWAEEYERETGDILALQNEVARDIAQGVHIRLTPREQSELSATGKVDPEIENLYWRGVYLFNKFTVLDFRRARDCFQQMVQKDPANPRGWTGLAMTGHLLATGGDFESFEPAKAAARKALELDQSMVEASAELAMLHYVYDWDVSEAEREFQRALDLNPNYGRTHYYYALMLSHIGRSEEAIREITLARRLDPLSVDTVSIRWHMYFCARQYDQAISAIEDSLEMDPNFAAAHLRLSWSWEQKGEYRKAIEEARKGAMMTGDDPRAVETESKLLEKAFVTGGAQGYWQRKLSTLLASMKPDSRYGNDDIARIYMHLNNPQKTMEWIEKGLERHDTFTHFWLPVAAEYDPLRGDPRFQKLLSAAGLPVPSGITSMDFPVLPGRQGKP